MALFTPVNQRRFTNVAVVRLKRGGKRFELAAYPNKVQSWRNGLEKSLDEVLQTPTVYTNLSQGVLAKKEDLKAAFETEDTEAIIKLILEKGEIQVSEKERGIMLDSLFKDIATIVSDKCVDPNTKRPIPVSVVERAMKDMHYSVNLHRNAKQQALDVIRQLKERIPIERAQMQLKIVGTAAAAGKSLRDKLKPLLSAVEKEETESKYECVCFIDPGNFRKLEELLKTDGKGATVEVISLATFKETNEPKSSGPSGSGEEADDEDDKTAAAGGAPEEKSGKPQPAQQQQQRRRGQKMPGEPDSEGEEGDEDTDHKKKGGKGKKGGRKKKPAAVAVKQPAKGNKPKAAAQHYTPENDDEDEEEKNEDDGDDSEALEEQLAANVQKQLALHPKVPALPKRSALTSGSEAEAEDAAKPPIPKGKQSNKAKGRPAANSAFSALADADDA